MSIVTVKNKFQEGARSSWKPKVVVNWDEYTPAQRRRIDAQLAKSLAEHKEGKSLGPFATHQEMIDFLHRQTKQSPRRTARKSSKHRSR